MSADGSHSSSRAEADGDTSGPFHRGDKQPSPNVALSLQTLQRAAYLHIANANVFRRAVSAFGKYRDGSHAAPELVLGVLVLVAAILMQISHG